MNIDHPDYVPDDTWLYPLPKYRQPRPSYRARLILTILLTIALLALAYWLNDVTTPPQCKPAAHKVMSQDCINLLYPN